jgi:hypothetical protein
MGAKPVWSGIVLTYPMKPSLFKLRLLPLAVDAKGAYYCILLKEQ